MRPTLLFILLPLAAASTIHNAKRIEETGTCSEWNNSCNLPQGVAYPCDTPVHQSPTPTTTSTLPF